MCGESGFGHACVWCLFGADVCAVCELPVLTRAAA
eukprot:COSAG05_NODE_6457_length_954_cov_1.708772_2_plen_34_part_01